MAARRPIVVVAGVAVGGLALALAAGGLLRPGSSSSPPGSSSVGAVATPGSTPLSCATATPATATPAVTPSTTSPITAGAGAGLARFNGPDWHFDYPADWTYYRNSDPGEGFMGGGSRSLGFLTSQAFDTDALCEPGDGVLACDLNAIEVEPGEVLVHVEHLSSIYGDKKPPGQGEIPKPQPGFASLVAESDKATGPHEVIGWMIHDRTSIHGWHEFSFVVGTPVPESRRAELEAAQASWTFDPPYRLIDPADAAKVLAETVHTYQAAGPGYSCFPDAMGVVEHAEVTSIAGRDLTQPLRVACRTTIRMSADNFWYVGMVATWDPEHERSSTRITVQEWVAWDGSLAGGVRIYGNTPYCCN